MTRPVLALAIVVLLAAAAPLPAVPAYREFERWFVACDNTRACNARGFDGAARVQLDLTRKAGDAPATLLFAAETPIVSHEMRLDGTPIAFPAPAWASKDGALSTSNPRAVTDFVAAARNGHVITLDTATAVDGRPRTVPLEGLADALLLIDAVQGRPGTRTALIAPTGKAVTPRAPPLPPAPRWTVPPALTRSEARRLMQQARSLPSQVFDACDVPDPPSIYPLDAVNALAIRPCRLAAYQEAFVVAVLPRVGGQAQPATRALPGVPQLGAGRGDMVDAEFDPATGRLSSTSKGRGLADCGSSEVWVWSGGSFRLKSLNFQRMCGGAEPGDWPPLFRTR